MIDTMRLAIIGDSITRGYGVPPGHGYAARLAERDLPGRVLTLAHDGATVRRWLVDFRPELGQLSTWAPTTVIVALGANDWFIAREPADYTAHLVQLVGEIRARSPGVTIIHWHYYPVALTPDGRVCDIQPCSPATPPATWHSYGTAMWNAAMATGTEYFDTAECRDWATCLKPDGAHLTPYGHYALYQALREQLLGLIAGSRSM